VWNGGGLCLFWSPAFGTSLLAKNWTAWSTHGLVARTVRQDVTWEDYWSVQADFEQAANRLVVSGRLADLPMAFEKTWQFHDDRVACTVTVEAEKAIQLCSLEMTFPYAASGPKATLLDAEGRPVRDGLAHAVRFDRGGGQAHVLVFDSPQTVEVREVESVDHYKTPRRHCCLVLGLPSQWGKGERRSFRSALVPTAVADVPDCVVRIVRGR